MTYDKLNPFTKDIVNSIQERLDDLQEFKDQEIKDALEFLVMEYSK